MDDQPPARQRPAASPNPPLVTRRALFYAAGFAAVAASVGLDLSSRSAPAHAFGIRPFGPWGGYSNGQIPLSALSLIPWAPGQRLRNDAAAALIDLNSEFRAAFKTNLPITEAYRDYSGQVKMRNYWCGQGRCNLAAVPGTSNHGWAIAIDIGVQRTNWSNPIYLWMKANAGRFGWYHPSWAGPSGSAPEAWHWQYNGTYSPEEPETEPEPEPEPELEENDMFLLKAVDTTKTPQIRWAVVGPGFWYVVSEKTTADGLSLRVGAEINISWAEWDRAFAAAVSSGFVPATGQTSRTV